MTRRESPIVRRSLRFPCLTGAALRPKAESRAYPRRKRDGTREARGRPEGRLPEESLGAEAGEPDPLRTKPQHSWRCHLTARRQEGWTYRQSGRGGSREA